MGRISLPMLFIFLCFVSTGWREAQAQPHPRTPISTFDASGAGTSAVPGTIPEQNTLVLSCASPQTQSEARPASQPIPSPEITKITVGFGPQGIAFAPGTVWVAYGNDRDFGVARIDEDTNKVIARVRTGRWPVGAAAGEGSVWIVNHDDNSVSRIDPESNRVLATIRVGKKPLGVEAGEGSIWVTNSGDGTVSRIDPKTNSVSAIIHVGKSPSGVSASNGVVWVSNFGGRLTRGGSLARIDPKTNTVTNTLKVSFANTVIAQGDDVWGTSQYEGAVVRIDGKSGTIVTTITVGGQQGGLAVSKGILWVADNSRATLWKVDIQTNTVIGKVEVGNSPIIFGRGVDPDGAIWVSNVDDGTVMKVKP
jgi:YVTN family beta-propeller protein